MAAHPGERIRITVVPTFVGGPMWRRLVVGVHGMLRATWLVLRGHTDVLHVHLAHGGSVIRKVLPLWAARLTGVPTVAHAHSYDFGGWFDRLPPLVQAVLRRVLVADHWVVLGERHVEEYANRLQLTANRISLLHNAVRIPDTPVTQLGVERCTRWRCGDLGAGGGAARSPRRTICMGTVCV